MSSLSRRISCVLLSLLTSALAAVPVNAQPQTRELGAYLALLGRYESGDYEGAARAALTLDPAAAHELGQLVIIEDIKGQMVQLKRLKALSRDAPIGPQLTQFRRERFRRLRLTVLVHTEAALRLTAPRPLGDQLTLARGWVTLLRDLAKDEWGSLEQDEWEGRERFVRDWHLVVASHLQAADQPRYLKAHVTSGLGLFRDDPELLLARGSISESEADVAVVDRSLSAEVYKSGFIERWRSYMSAAGRDYQEAARNQADLHEATLRWGRINRHLGDRRAARQALGQVAASDAPTALKYLARIFLGELSELEQQPADAVTEFQAALALVPSAQAPMLALSRLCDAAADVPCASQWLQRSFDATRRNRVDPWWQYQRGQAWMLEGRLARLRAEGLGK
jgi:tetratricopeptide (TPR) repeat protein